MMDADRLERRMVWFRERCKESGLACTHQRQVIYRALAESEAHPSPELVYESVRTRIPAISLATIYKSIRTFIDQGLLMQVNPLHESARLDANLEPHHHLVCTACKSVQDLPPEMLEPLRPTHPLPNGFRPRQFHVEVLGLCARCAERA
ncbi:MAG: transcriptional repressor [Acidobacteria bacterium]|nr:transcriptional repressor [Acidobacteriota bacterium]